MKRLIPLLFSLLLLFSLFSCSEKPAENENKPPRSPMGDDSLVTVLLDAGHGFGDVGCTSDYLGGLYEYQLTMDFTERLAHKLRSFGYNVIMTHDGEELPSTDEICKAADRLGVKYDPEKMSPDNNVFDAYERAIYANVLCAENEIDFFLSIHVNANADTDTATGFEIDYCAENASSDMSVFAFDAICESLSDSYPERRLKKFADSFDMSFIVNKYTDMPSVLFETGFASTPSDAELLLDESWRDALMDSVAAGLKAYFDLSESDDLRWSVKLVDKSTFMCYNMLNDNLYCCF